MTIIRRILNWLKRAVRALFRALVPVRRVDQILDCLNRERVRATYGAVGDVLGLPPQSVGRALGRQTPRASWVVNAKAGEPTGYPIVQKHPDLYRTRHIIRSGQELWDLLEGGEHR